MNNSVVFRHLALGLALCSILGGVESARAEKKPAPALKTVCTQQVPSVVPYPNEDLSLAYGVLARIVPSATNKQLIVSDSGADQLFLTTDDNILYATPAVEDIR